MAGLRLKRRPWAETPEGEIHLTVIWPDGHTAELVISGGTTRDRRCRNHTRPPSGPTVQLLRAAPAVRLVREI